MPHPEKMFLSVKKCRYVINVIHIYTPVIVSDVFPGQAEMHFIYLNKFKVSIIHEFMH